MCVHAYTCAEFNAIERELSGSRRATKGNVRYARAREPDATIITRIG